jgi:peroxin-1
LDQILPATSSDQQDSGAGLQSSQRAEALYDALTRFGAQHASQPVAVLATCASASSHHALCNLMFPHVLTMANPDANDRVDIIQKLIMALSSSPSPSTTSASASASAAAAGSTTTVKLSRKVELSVLARRTEGYTPADLKQLVTRALHAAMTRSMHSHAPVPLPSSADAQSSTALQLHSAARRSALPAVSSSSSSPASVFLLHPADFDAAFRGFVPSALKELALGDGTSEDASTHQTHASPTAGWDSVGGLFELKRMLLDTLELPTRYAALFATAPLKLRSGLLIYGPPGCGKVCLTATACRNGVLRSYS